MHLFLFSHFHLLCTQGTSPTSSLWSPCWLPNMGPSYSQESWKGMLPSGKEASSSHNAHIQPFYDISLGTCASGNVGCRLSWGSNIYLGTTVPTACVCSHATVEVCEHTVQVNRKKSDIHTHENYDNPRKVSPNVQQLGWGRVKWFISNMPEGWITILCTIVTPSPENRCWTRSFLKTSISILLIIFLIKCNQNKEQRQFNETCLCHMPRKLLFWTVRTPDLWLTLAKENLSMLTYMMDRKDKNKCQAGLFHLTKAYFSPILLLGLKHSCPACRHFKHDQICASLQITTDQQWAPLHRFGNVWLKLPMTEGL